jgi:hypothetical protein
MKTVRNFYTAKLHRVFDKIKNYIFFKIFVTNSGNIDDYTLKRDFTHSSTLCNFRKYNIKKEYI